jgi:hypothetical protein
MSLKLTFAAASVLFLVAGCAGSTNPDDASDSAEAVTAHADKVHDFECTSVASSASVDALKSTRLDITADETVAGVPTQQLVTGFEASLHATSAVGFGVSHVRDTTVSGHQISEYKINFGADSIIPGATGGTLTVPTAMTKLALESSAELNVATLTLQPGDATVTFKCKKDPRKPQANPAPDFLQFTGAAKTVVAHDSCAKDVASKATDQIIGKLEDDGVDIPDTFTYTSIEHTSTGYDMVVNGEKISAVVGSGCAIKSMDTSAATGDE